jgi:hypothetical protein
MAKSRLSDILEQEYKTKGILSGASSAIGKRTMEKLDIRNALFGGSGLGSIIGRKVFGKGYSATRKKDEGISSVSQDLSTANNVQLEELTANSRITAKNTLALPSMARDMHLVKQNIMKLVKLQGGTPQTKAGDWFQRQAAREAAFESKFAKNNSQKPSQLKSEGKSSSGGLISSLLGTLAGNLTGTFSKIVITAVAVGYVLDKLAVGIKKLYNWLATSWLGKKIGLKPLSSGEGLAGPFGREDNSGVLGEEGESGRNSLGSTLADYGAIAGITAAGVYGVKGGMKLAKATGAAGTAIMDVRTMSTGQLANSNPKSKWGRFLAFVAKKSPKLFGRIALKLAQAGALATIPFVGWVGAAIQLGFSLWTAWEIYELWKEFTKSDTGDESVSDDTSTKPSPISNNDSNSQGLTQNQTSSTSPMALPAGQGPKDMADLIRRKFKEAGFNDAQAEAAVANAIAESGLNPKARNQSGGEDSVGLFQMNRNGGLGSGKTVEELMDPNYNIDLAIAAAKKSKAFMSATNVNDAVTAFVKDVERPKNQQAAIEKRIKIAGSTINEQSKQVASGNRSGGNQVAVNNTNNINNNSGGGSSGQLASADVMDTELGRLLLTRMY